MEEQTQDGVPDLETGSYEPPRFVVIPLDCEITAYAPAGDEPLF